MIVLTRAGREGRRGVVGPVSITAYFSPVIRYHLLVTYFSTLGSAFEATRAPFSGRHTMPIEVGLWRLGEQLKKVEFCPIDSESRLEDVLADDISVIHPGWLLIGRQVSTA